MPVISSELCGIQMASTAEKSKQFPTALYHNGKVATPWSSLRRSSFSTHSNTKHSSYRDKLRCRGDAQLAQVAQLLASRRVSSSAFAEAPTILSPNMVGCQRADQTDPLYGSSSANVEVLAYAPQTMVYSQRVGQRDSAISSSSANVDVPDGNISSIDDNAIAELRIHANFVSSSEHSNEKLSSAGSAHVHSQACSARSSTPSNSADEEVSWFFDSKEDYKDQESFDAAVRRHCIEEEVHRTARAETKHEQQERARVLSVIAGVHRPYVGVRDGYLSARPLSKRRPARMALCEGGKRALANLPI